jgi:hypothetical protein
MSQGETPASGEGAVERSPQRRLDLFLRGANRRKYMRFGMAALGSIPWVGGVLSVGAMLASEAEQSKISELQRQWLDEHQAKIEELAHALSDIVERVETLGEDAAARLETDSYLALVRRAFHVWDESATEEKRQLVQNLLANAAGTAITSDDLVRLFIEWIDRYHEVHFAIIRLVFKNPGCTRLGIWRALSGPAARDDSPEADLFRLLIYDLSAGRIIRQEREVSAGGEFVKKRHRPSSSPYMKSAFDSGEGYELTELGKQFVHYTMSGIVPRLGGPHEGQEQQGGQDA